MTYCQEVAQYLQNTINWLNSVVRWLNGLWWLFGAQNWAINEINSYINTLQGWETWVKANCSETNVISEIVSAVGPIVSFVEWIISIF
jgi:hypothetical protein